MLVIVRVLQENYPYPFSICFLPLYFLYIVSFLWFSLYCFLPLDFLCLLLLHLPFRIQMDRELHRAFDLDLKQQEVDGNVLP